MGFTPVHVDLSMSTVEDSENNLKSNLTFLKTTLSQLLLISLSIFDSWGHMRTLCQLTGHPRRKAPVSPYNPVWQLINVCSRTVSSHETRDPWLRRASDITCGPCKRVSMMYETGIEPSCVGIGQKLVSVDRKVSTTMVMTWWPLLLCDLGFYGFVLEPIHG